MNNAGWILIGGAVLLLLLNRRTPNSTRAVQQQTPATGGGIPAAGGGISATGGSTGSSAPPTGNAAANAAGAMPESVGTPPPDDVLKQAALDPSKASLAGEWRFSWHAWNYYRAQAAIEAGLCSPPCPEYAPVLGERFGLTDNQGLTASEYHGYLSQLGMSGLTWRYVKAYRRPWQ
jgi:hypothetical protein